MKRANDWSCQPSADHPRPVVLVHGTFANMATNWAAMSPVLADAGYCVFALNYGGEPGSLFKALGPIEESAAELDAFVDRVLAATGADEVDIVGHSQGGMMPRYYIKFLGGADEVNALIGLAPSNHGTTLHGLATLAEKYFPAAGDLLGSECQACMQQAKGSDFLQRLNSGDETPPGVSYTVIATEYDEIVTPYTSGFLEGADNLTAQDLCAATLAEHGLVAFDAVVIHEVMNRLDPDSATPTTCEAYLPWTQQR